MIRSARLLAIAALLGCSDLTGGEAGIATIEVTTPSPAKVFVGNSLQLSARALDRSGAPVTADIFWVTPDTTITVNSATGVVAGVSVGSGRVQALNGSLASALVTVTVVATPRPTPLFAGGPLRRPR